jgi:hypothetical protein
LLLLLIRKKYLGCLSKKYSLSINE